MTHALNSHAALLPAGLSDLLPPGAEQEAAAISGLMRAFAAQGYERIRPPLVEFEDSLTAHGVGKALSRQTFRMMDPVSQRMMGVRADMTPQIARIARTRLGGMARPLRLCYAGQVLRVNGTQLRPAREFTQLGCELIGTLEPAADAEVLILAVEALAGLGIDGLSVDLCVPTLAPKLCDALEVGKDDRAAFMDAIAQRDEAALNSLDGGLDGGLGETAVALLAASGPIEHALEKLQTVTLPDKAARELQRLYDVWPMLQTALADMDNPPQVTIDPLETRGFEYQTGLSFTLFMRDGRGELGRGGRYRAAFPGSGDDVAEPAVGFSLYSDSLMPSLPETVAQKRVFTPLGTTPGQVRALRDDGWIVVAAVAQSDDPAADAKAMRCSHVFDGGECRDI